MSFSLDALWLFILLHGVGTPCSPARQFVFARGDLSNFSIDAGLIAGLKLGSCLGSCLGSRWAQAGLKLGSFKFKCNK